MNIAQFPKGEQLSLAHKPLIDDVNGQLGNNGSALQFSNLFLLDSGNSLAVAQINNQLLFFDRELALSEQDVQLLSAQKHLPAIIAELQESQVRRIIGLPYPIEQAKSDPDNADYLYSCSTLKEMAGSSFAPVRRKINTCAKQGSIKLSTATNNFDELWDLQQTWATTEDDDSKELESIALEKACIFMDQLNLQPVIMTINKQIAGFAIVEKIPQDTLLIHFFKTDRTITGAAETLFTQLAHYFTESKIINFEQDLGLPGLIQFKKNLRPLEKKMVYTLDLAKE